MTFVSYAQNFEDLILWRALKHVANGFYIDVGAQDPVHDSVSMGFYEKGWRGVHVEASAAYAEKLRRARPDEKVIELAIDSEEGEIVFYEIPSTGLSTGDNAIADQHAAEGHIVEQKRIKSIPLSAVLQVYGDRDVHWLKIDVEGMEEAAIAGWLPSEVRPWVVAVESTLPNSRELRHHAWEPKLIALGYDFVYFDGLNRFYVSHLHLELKSAFGLAPNIFDEFVLAPTSAFAGATSIEKEANIVLRHDLEMETAARIALEAEIRSQRQTVQARVAELDAEVMALKAVQLSAEQQLLAIKGSRSWMITAPLRQVAKSLHLTRNGIVSWATFRTGSRPRRVLKSQLIARFDWIRSKPRLMSLARRLSRISPRLTNRLRVAYFSSPDSTDGGTVWKYEADVRALEKWLLKLNS